MAQRTVGKYEGRKVLTSTPMFHVFHVNEERSDLYFSVSSRELLYNRTNANSDDNIAVIKIQYKFFDFNKQLLDSGSVDYSDVNNQQKIKVISGNVPFACKRGQKGFLRITFSDKKRNAHLDMIIDIDKSNGFSKQNFLLKNVDSAGSVIVGNYVTQPKVRLYSTVNAGKIVQVRVYKQNFGIPPAPHENVKYLPLNYKADSLYEIRLDENGSALLQLPQKGFLHVVQDTSTKSGMTIVRVPQYFPLVASADVLIEPLGLICTANEMTLLSQAIDKKRALDAFWLEHVGGKDKAREVIKYFYMRVQEANRRFSSYLEGWKTDRGMVFVIFGPPTRVENNAEYDTWVYGDIYSATSMRFNFIKSNTPFSENDYYLQRLPQFKSEWYRALDYWRSGRVYNFTN
jgi:GWxTD domain-containing protein